MPVLVQVYSFHLIQVFFWFLLLALEKSGFVTPFWANVCTTLYPWKCQGKEGFLMFPGGIKKKRCGELGLRLYVMIMSGTPFTVNLHSIVA